jgi:hypothetical protein
VITERLDRSGYGARAIFGERFTRQNDVVIALFDRSAGAAIVRRPIVEPAAIFASALRRGIFRRRQVAAAAALPVRTPISIPVATAAASSAAPSKTSPAATPAAISAAISASVTATIISLRPIIADARRIVAGRIVAGREILRGRSVRFRLALVELAALGMLAFTAGIPFALLGRAVKFFG